MMMVYYMFEDRKPYYCIILHVIQDGEPDGVTVSPPLGGGGGGVDVD